MRLEEKDRTREAEKRIMGRKGKRGQKRRKEGRKEERMRRR